MGVLETYTLTTEPKGQLYQSIISAAIGQSRTLGLVVRQDVNFKAEARQALEALSPLCVERAKALEWPGTMIFKKPAEIYRYDMSEELVNVICGLSGGLYDWRAPLMPEDLFILRSDGSTWLGTIAHESDGYFELTQDEHENLVRGIPGLMDVLRRESQ